MATTRLLRSLRPLPSVLSSSSSSSVSVRTVRCLSNTRFNHIHDDKSRQMVVVNATVATSEIVETANTRVSDLPSLLAYVFEAILLPLKAVVGMKIRKLQIQMFVEKVIINCRFFTLFAVAGSLIGSILCYVEGSCIVAESYLEYFITLSQPQSQGSDKGHIIELLIEAIDMFLFGTALVVFGVGLYAMFVGSKNMKEKGTCLAGSNFFGLFYMKKLPTWVEMRSVSAEKSKIGHAMMMILQVGVLEKFKTVPLVSAADLACFAGAVLISSASVFFLSRLTHGGGN